MIRTLLFLLSVGILTLQNHGPSRSGALAGAAAHTFSKVQASTSCSANSSSNTYITCAFATTTTVGNSIIFGCEGSATTITTSPAATSLLTLYNGAYGYAYLGVAPIATGATSATVTTGTYQSEQCVAAEIHGVQTSSPEDGTGSAFAAGSYGTSVSTGSATTTNAADVVFGMVSGGPLGTCTAGTGFTLVGSNTYSTTYQTCLEYKQLSAAGSTNPSMSWTTGGSTTVGTAALKLQ